MISQALCLIAVLALCPLAFAAEWSWEWRPGPNDPAPTVEVCPFKYAKDWAYTVIIDDGPAFTLTLAQPLVSRQTFTDAPPGIPGGKPMPFVGGAAVIIQRLDTTNPDYLHWDNLRKLQTLGWGVINHGYAHVGRSFGPWPQVLTPDQLRREVFWSQTVIAAELGNGRAPSHFVYPNGYTPYRDYLTAVGLVSASRSSGNDPGAGDAYSPKADVLDLHRVYLDEGIWTEAPAGGRILHGFPADDQPAPGQVILDFTHKIDPDPQSANYQRWKQRLTTIATRFGQGGRDDVWSASPGDIYDYVAARKAAKVHAERGQITVKLPDSIPGSPLTLKLTGIGPATPLAAPPGGTLYRKGDVVWLTTPLIGQPGSPAPKPHLQRVYSGAVKNLTWDKPIALAGIRILQTRAAAEAFELRLDIQSPQGQTENLVPKDQATLGKSTGAWLLFDILPNRPAVQATSLTITPDPSLEKLEVWTLAEDK